MIAWARKPRRCCERDGRDRSAPKPFGNAVEETETLCLACLFLVEKGKKGEWQAWCGECGAQTRHNLSRGEASMSSCMKLGETNGRRARDVAMCGDASIGATTRREQVGGVGNAMGEDGDDAGGGATVVVMGVVRLGIALGKPSGEGGRGGRRGEGQRGWRVGWEGENKEKEEEKKRKEEDVGLGRVVFGPNWILGFHFIFVFLSF